jgi:acetyl esterase
MEEGMTSGLDVDIKKILPLLPLKDAANLTSKRARDELVALTDSRKDVPLPQPAEVAELTIEGVRGPIGARLYRASKSRAPTVVYFHGGGWVAGDLYTHDRIARTLAIELEAVVISVDYRRPPEVRFPGAYEDCLAATHWAAENISALGNDPSRLAVAGDSAGGQLATSVAQACKDRGPRLKAQLLFYPVTDVSGAYRSSANNASYPSRQTNANGYFLSTDAMRFFAQQYLADVADGNDWRVSPLRATDLKNMPPTILTTAEFDPLRDEGDAYAHALQQAGVRVDHLREEGMVHGYVGMGAASPAADLARRRAVDAFKACLRH